MILLYFIARKRGAGMNMDTPESLRRDALAMARETFDRSRARGKSVSEAKDDARWMVDASPGGSMARDIDASCDRAERKYQEAVEANRRFHAARKK